MLILVVQDEDDFEEAFAAAFNEALADEGRKRKPKHDRLAYAVLARLRERMTIGTAVALKRDLDTEIERRRTETDNDGK